MKTISVRQFASIKRIYMNVNPLIVKKNKIISKINELTVEIAQLNDEIEGNEMGIKTITDGLSSEDLIVKKVIDTDKTDKNGNIIKVTKYEPNPERLQWDEEKKVYNLIIPTIEEYIGEDSTIEDTANEVEESTEEVFPDDLEAVPTEE